MGLRSSGGEGDKGAGDFNRRAFLATTLAPLASVSCVYLAVPTLLSEDVRKADWYKRAFADRMGGMDNYESNIREMKEDLFSLIRPDDAVVELGAGLGPNIKMLPASIAYTAVEPNKFMHAAIEERAAEHFEFEQDQLILQDLRSVATGSADVVMSTLVLCSVADQNQILDEVLRVLKPGGMLIFLEHVIEPYDIYPTPGNVQTYQWGKAFYRAFQSAMSPLQAALADGCHADRCARVLGCVRTLAHRVCVCADAPLSLLRTQSPVRIIWAETQSKRYRAAFRSCTTSVSACLRPGVATIGPPTSQSDPRCTWHARTRAHAFTFFYYILTFLHYKFNHSMPPSPLSPSPPLPSSPPSPPPLFSPAPLAPLSPLSRPGETQVGGVAIKTPLSYEGQLAEVQFKFCAPDALAVTSLTEEQVCVCLCVCVSAVCVFPLGLRHLLILISN